MALGAMLLGGCATSLSSFRPAHVPRKGSFHAAAGLDVSVPTGSIIDTIDAGRDAAAAATNRSLDQEEQDQLIDAGIALATNPPALQQTLGIAYAPIEDTELSLRYAGGTWRLGGRLQLWEQGRGHDWDLTVGLGMGRQSVSFPVSNVLDVVKVRDFSRWSLDLPVAFGRRASWYRVWGGPRLMFTWADTGLALNLPATADTPARTLAASGETRGVYWGGQAGLAFGYRGVFIGMELTLVQFTGEASVETTAGGTASSRTVDVDTFVVFPGLALMAEF